MRAVHSKDETERHYGAQQVARNHDALAVQTVERHTGQRACEDRRDGAREHHAGHHHAAA